MPRIGGRLEALKGTEMTTSEVLLTTKRHDGKLYVEGTCGSVSASVWFGSEGVRVICKNASHRVWRGWGRLFATVAEALDAYRKPEMKAIITAADQANR